MVRARELVRRMQYKGSKGLIVRKTYPELLSNHIRMFFQEYPQTREWFKAAEKAIYWPNGSVTEFSYLKSTNDVYTYQGREYEDISIDEITQHEEEVFKILRSSNRTVNPKIKPSMFLTGNPGGIGHGWAKRLFVDRHYTENETPEDFGFVQARVYDNKKLMEADPDYVKRLMDLPEDKRRAYLEGDWDVFAGQVFTEFRREKHVIKPLTPKQSFPHFLWTDWGYSEKSAFAAYASVLIQMKTEDGDPVNRVITYQEWYGNQKDPQTWAKIIYETAHCRRFRKWIVDPSMLNPGTDGSKPIAKQFQDAWLKLHKRNWLPQVEGGSKNRIQRVATTHNWLGDAPDGKPYWLMTDNCQNLIRTLPLLVYDENKVEDVDTTQEDHSWDSASYGLGHIKFISAARGLIGKKKMHIPERVKPAVPKIDLDEFAKGNKKSRDWRYV